MTASVPPDGNADLFRRIDTTVAHPARRYNYWLGGKDHFPADRESAEKIMKKFPHVAEAAKANRAFLGRAVRYLAEQGVRQFLDIGTGIPTADNTHEVAQAVAADSRIVYVDNDPIVLAHARALLTSTDSGAVAYLDQDLRHPEHILADPGLAATLDPAKPVGLLLVAVLHFIADHDDPGRIVAHLLDPLPPGSHLALSHGTADYLNPTARAALPALTADDAAQFHPRSDREISAWLTGLDPVDPGLVSVVDWHPTEEPLHSAADIGVHCVVARKP
ncbi:SAM-dependent methyltransferase [Dactylosporangium sp. CA-139066]|uniref:SAM-dependent methyltransferase n=1 Tax=Dactylosporangium sp. CA-139066 TaxID=3239930 RepID=UPI003D8BE09D